jgi:hypothetical protein
LEETSKGLYLKDDVAFALLIAIYPHMATMFNELNNLLGLETHWIRNHASRQHGSIIGENNREEVIYCSNRVKVDFATKCNICTL